MCKCGDYINFSEPPYEENSTEKMWCGRSPYTFRSSGRVLVISYVFQTSHNHPFNLSYVSESEYIHWFIHDFWFAFVWLYFTFVFVCIYILFMQEIWLRIKALCRLIKPPKLMCWNHHFFRIFIHEIWPLNIWLSASQMIPANVISNYHFLIFK